MLITFARKFKVISQSELENHRPKQSFTEEIITFSFRSSCAQNGFEMPAKIHNSALFQISVLLFQKMSKFCKNCIDKYFELVLSVFSLNDSGYLVSKVAILKNIKMRLPHPRSVFSSTVHKYVLAQNMKKAYYSICVQQIQFSRIFSPRI